MRKFLTDNYNSIVDRGLIAPSTNVDAFSEKTQEELKEAIEASTGGINDYLLEIADLACVALNWGYHYAGEDFENYLYQVLEKNQKRKR